MQHCTICQIVQCCIFWYVENRENRLLFAPFSQTTLGCLWLLLVQYITQQLFGILVSAVHWRFSLCLHLKMCLLFTSLEMVDLCSEAVYLGLKNLCGRAVGKFSVIFIFLYFVMMHFVLALKLLAKRCSKTGYISRA